jgi:hypothetical protein
MSDSMLLLLLLRGRSCSVWLHEHSLHSRLVLQVVLLQFSLAARYRNMDTSVPFALLTARR